MQLTRFSSRLFWLWNYKWDLVCTVRDPSRCPVHVHSFKIKWHLHEVRQTKTDCACFIVWTFSQVIYLHRVKLQTVASCTSKCTFQQSKPDKDQTREQTSFIKQQMGLSSSLSCLQITPPLKIKSADIKAPVKRENAQTHPCEIDTQSATLSGRKAQAWVMQQRSDHLSEPLWRDLWAVCSLTKALTFFN